MSSPDGIIRNSLSNFVDEYLDGSWTGQREREAVSTFVFGSLLEAVDTDGFLHDPTQIGIEVPVPQVTRPDEDPSGKKSQVCKDLVIWHEPQTTCWDSQGNPTTVPALILEWKFSTTEVSEYDVNWLKAFTGKYADCHGYAVTANQPGSTFRLSCTKVAGGKTEPEWLYIP